MGCPVMPGRLAGQPWWGERGGGGGGGGGVCVSAGWLARALQGNAPSECVLTLPDTWLGGCMCMSTNTPTQTIE